MNYPTLDQYITAILRAKYSFRTLSHLQPTFDESGKTIFILDEGNVIFKMLDTSTGKFTGVKCFISKQPLSKKHYHQIEEFIEKQSFVSDIHYFLVKYKYYYEELWINTGSDEQGMYDILIYDWVEGCTLFLYLKHHCNNGNINVIKQIAEEFDRLAIWLLGQSFIYNNFKPSNIFKPIGSDYLLLLDYESIHISAHKVEKSIDLSANESKYSKLILTNITNEYKSILAFSLSLHVLAEHPNWFTIYSQEDALIFKKEDFNSIDSIIFHNIRCECKNWIVQKRLLGLLHTLEVPGITNDLMFFYIQPLSTYMKKLIPWAIIDANERHNWGFVNWKKETVIPCIYDSVELFDEGLSIVKRDGKKGIINEAGKEVVPCIYDSIYSFIEGFAKVERKINNRYKIGLINKLGEEVTSFNYDEVNDFSEGLARVKRNKKEGFIDKTGKEVIPCIYDMVADFQEGIATIINYEYSLQKVDFRQSFQQEEQKNKQYGFINKMGYEVVTPSYEDTSGFHKRIKGLSQVRKNEKWGLIDKSGQVIVPCIYDNLGWSFKDELLMANKGNKWGFIDIYGREIIPCIYDNVNDFYEGMAGVSKNDNWGFVNSKGDEIVPCIYSSSNNNFFVDGLARVKKDNKYGLIDKMGEEVIPCIYDFISSTFSEGLASVCKNNKWGFVDKIGNEIVTCIYDGFNYSGESDFHEEFAKVCKNEKYGFINKFGDEIISCCYENVRNFNQGFAPIKKNSKWGFINKLGEEVIPCIYDDVSNFQEGLAKVFKNRKYGFVDKTGFEIISCYHDSANDFKDGLAWVESEDLGLRFLIDKMGVEYCSWPEI